MEKSLKLIFRIVWSSRILPLDKDFLVQDFNLHIFKNYMIIQTLTNFVLEGYRFR